MWHENKSTLSDTSTQITIIPIYISYPDRIQVTNHFVDHYPGYSPPPPYNNGSVPFISPYQ